MIQLDLFSSEIEVLREELQKQRTEMGNVRRGLFARHNELAKILLKVQQDIEELKGHESLKPKSAIIELMEYVN